MPFLTVSKIAERWGCQQRQVLAHISTGKLAACNIGRPGATRPTWRIRLEDLEAFERRRSTALPAPPAKRKRATAKPVKEFF